MRAAVISNTFFTLSALSSEAFEHLTILHLSTDIYRLWDDHRRLILIIAAPVDVFIWGLVMLRPQKFTEGTWTVKLVAGCEMDFVTSVGAVALACPGVDYMRLWPLPVVQPWQSTPDPMKGWMAKRVGCPGGATLMWNVVQLARPED